VIDFASLFWFGAYGAAILAIGLVLRLIARWSAGASVADGFGGYRDPPWPRGVQEEEPVRWHLERLRPRDEREKHGTLTRVAACAMPRITPRG
jgi:hypothetical protein